MNDNCIFCKIINGSIPSSKVYEDDNFLSILDISPSSKGHAVLFPKTHCQNLFDADEQLLKTLLPTARKIASAIKSTVNCDGINLLQNNEPAAGQTIYHLHMHIIPRYENDGCTIKWEKVSYEENEAPALAKQIADRIFQNGGVYTPSPKDFQRIYELKNNKITEYNQKCEKQYNPTTVNTLSY